MPMGPHPREPNDRVYRLKLYGSEAGSEGWGLGQGEIIYSSKSRK